MTRRDMETRRLYVAMRIQEGERKSSVALEARISRTSVSRIARQVRDGIDLSSRKSPGRPMSLDFTERTLLLFRFKTEGQNWSGTEVQRIIAVWGKKLSYDHCLRLKYGMEKAVKEGAEDFRPLEHKPK